METNISKLSNGLYQVKPQGEPARCFYTQAQAQKFLEKFNSSNLQPLANDTVQIAPRKKHTWTNYAQEHGTTYTKPPKSGVVIADERAAQIIAQNAEKAAQQTAATSATAKPAATTTTTQAAHAPATPKAPVTATTTQAVHAPATPKAPAPKPATPKVTTQVAETSQVKETIAKIMDSIRETAKKGVEAIQETAGKATEKIKETAATVTKKMEKPAEKLTETTRNWWKSLKTSVEKNPGKWGIGAAGAALVLLLISNLGKDNKRTN